MATDKIGKNPITIETFVYTYTPIAISANTEVEVTPNNLASFPSGKTVIGITQIASGNQYLVPRNYEANGTMKIANRGTTQVTAYPGMTVTLI